MWQVMISRYVVCIYHERDLRNLLIKFSAPPREQQRIRRCLRDCDALPWVVRKAIAAAGSTDWYDRNGASPAGNTQSWDRQGERRATGIQSSRLASDIAIGGIVICSYWSIGAGGVQDS